MRTLMLFLCLAAGSQAPLVGQRLQPFLGSHVASDYSPADAGASLTRTEMFMLGGTVLGAVTGYVVAQATNCSSSGAPFMPGQSTDVGPSCRGSNKPFVFAFAGAIAGAVGGYLVDRATRATRPVREP